MSALGEIVWSERFWFPENVTWDTLYGDIDVGDQVPSRFAPRPWHLWVSLACAVGVHLARRALERWALEPLGRRLGVSASPQSSLSPNAELEALFRLSRRPDKSATSAAAARLGWSERAVEHWLRRRRNAQKASTLRKFVESAWFIVYYVCALAFGSVVLPRESFFWDTRLCWEGWPHLHVSLPVRCYYTVQLGFYLASLYSVFHDVKRKDFVEMLLHHLVTVWLVAFSWCVNFVRIGALVLLLHDFVDPLLHLAKCLGYANRQSARDRVFCVFFVVWFATRLVLFPGWLLYSASVESWAALGPFGAYWVFNACLCVLQVLHVVWFYFIARIAYQVVSHGSLQGDERSDSEMSADSDEEPPPASAIAAVGGGSSAACGDLIDRKMR